MNDSTQKMPKPTTNEAGLHAGSVTQLRSPTGTLPEATQPPTARLLDGRPVFRCWRALVDSARRGQSDDELPSFIHHRRPHKTRRRPGLSGKSPAPAVDLFLPGFLRWERSRLKPGIARTRRSEQDRKWHFFSGGASWLLGNGSQNDQNKAK